MSPSSSSRSGKSKGCPKTASDFANSTIILLEGKKSKGSLLLQLG